MAKVGGTRDVARHKSDEVVYNRSTAHIERIMQKQKKNSPLEITVVPFFVATRACKMISPSPFDRKC